MGRLMVIGASGLLGHDVCLLLRDRFEIVGTHYDHPFSMDGVESIHLDLVDPDAMIDTIASVDPDIVVLCGAMTGVDACEDDPDLADALNHRAVAYVVEALEGTSTKLVQVSTDYVFDGGLDRAYEEADPTNPKGEYGRTKLLGERAALARPGTLVLRASSVWGPDPREGRQSFGTWVLSKLDRGEPVQLFTDQHVTPTYTGTFAHAIPIMLEEDLEGVYHLAASSCLTRYECGRLLAEAFGLDTTLIEPSTLAGASLKAPRPLMSCLDVTKVQRALGHEVGTYQNDIKDFLRRSIGDDRDGDKEEGTP